MPVHYFLLCIKKSYTLKRTILCVMLTLSFADTISILVKIQKKYNANTTHSLILKYGLILLMHLYDLLIHNKRQWWLRGAFVYCSIHIFNYIYIVEYLILLIKNKKNIKIDLQHVQISKWEKFIKKSQIWKLLIKL